MQMKFNDGIMSIESKVTRLATDFAMLCERYTCEMTPVLCNDAQFIYSRLENIAGLLDEFRMAFVKPLEGEEGRIVKSWKIANGELYDAD